MSVKIDRIDEIATFVSIQGLIGSGKSCLMDAIERNIKKNGLSAVDAKSPPPRGTDLFLLIQEPVDKWTEVNCSLLDCDGKGSDSKKYSFLDLYYKGMKTVTTAATAIEEPIDSSVDEADESVTNPFAYGFQTFTFTTRFGSLSNGVASIPHFPADSGVRVHLIAERSVRADRLFFKNVYESRGCKDYEWRNYEQFHQTFCTATMEREDLMVRLNTSALKSHDRLCNKRMREAEVNNGVPLAYLESLEKQHEEMYANFALEKGKDRVVDVNFERDMNTEEIDKVAADLIDRIKAFRR